MSLPTNKLRPLLDKKAIFIVALALIGIFLVFGIYWFRSPKGELKPIDPVNFKGTVIDPNDAKLLKKALERNINYLTKIKETNASVLKREGYAWNTQDLIEAVDSLIDHISSAEKHHDLYDLIKGRFKVIAVKRPVLVTGYYLPEFRASRAPNEQYNTPILGVPKDLITIRLRDFFPHSQNLNHLVLRGRVEGNLVVPYYPRKEIELKDDLPVIAYLEDPIKLLILHIQGSGILKFNDGSSSYVHYAADNGHPYKSIGKILINRGILKKEEADWNGIEKWYWSNPKKAERIIHENPRYIFFREEQGIKDAIGATHVPLTAYHSIAVDPTKLPLGGLFILDVNLPDLGRLLTIVVAQDKGAAIKGTHHIDLFLGKGDEAGRIAGKLKSNGKLYCLIPVNP
ncbi:Membrane-bound lytic murein transglycosylase A precursor [Dissulfuribacter thermophilus]|uniref:peptidoglycan lytic exotransglycosylase n=1 Tax=Dissulfuribacter thermophilus TaxID=1156395 RepID=A0A1B9F7E9_9BACT|nr:MltA domain-containing protein [Dissulfuribacter thermophilus]OCC15820.1 Membrane-bound lytic murein transglycosylase A precursor [Dissulfuribacter thermophilus]